jgi:hypothetical protein
LTVRAGTNIFSGPEEQTVAEALFSNRGSSSCLADMPQSRLEPMARAAQAWLIAEPDLISSHFAWLLPALPISF